MVTTLNWILDASHILDLLAVATPRIEWMKLDGIKAANGLLVPLFFLFWMLLLSPYNFMPLEEYFSSQLYWNSSRFPISSKQEQLSSNFE